MRLASTVFDDGEPVESEIEEVGHVVALAIGDDIRAHLNDIRTRVRRGGAVAVVGFAFGVALVAFGSMTIGIMLAAFALVAGGGHAVYALRDDPEVTVTDIEKRYWTAHLLPQQDGVLVYDATATLPESEFELEQLDENQLTSATKRIHKYDPNNLPLVRTNENDPEADILRDLQVVKKTLADTESTRLSASVVEESSDLVEGVKSAASIGVEDHHPTDSMAVSLDKAEETAEQIRQLETLAFETDPAKKLESLQNRPEEAVRAITSTTAESIERLNDHIDTAGEILALVSYNFYCPDCIEDGINSELELEFGDRTQWFCDTCQGAFNTDDEPVPKHAIKDNLIEDIWDRLWIEKDDQRREIYENIEDQKTDLEEREFEQHREEIRTAADRIKDNRSKIRDLRTKARAKRGAIKRIGEVMERYDRLATERRQQFERDVEDAFAEIEQEVDEMIEEMRTYEQQKIEASQAEAEKRAEIARIEERLRHQERVAVNEEYRQEIRKKREKAERLREAEGKLSNYELVNDVRDMKARMRQQLPGTHIDVTER